VGKNEAKEGWPTSKRTHLVFGMKKEKKGLKRYFVFPAARDKLKKSLRKVAAALRVKPPKGGKGQE